MATVAVVGAGIVGASIAFRLAQGGARVVIIDRGRPGGGTTSNSFAWVNSNQKTPRDYFELNLAGLREHYRLRDELGAAPWFHPGGNLTWTGDAEHLAALEARVERLRDWGYAAGWMTGAAVNTELEPGLALPGPQASVAYFPDEAWVDAPLYAARMIEMASAAGATLRREETVAALDVEGGRAVAVRLASGERLAVDAIVNAAGPGADQVAALAGLPLPLTPSRGLLARVAVDGHPLGRLVHSPEISMRPDGPGHLLLAHTSIDARLGERASVPADDPLCRELAERAARVLPATAGAPVVAARVGVRPYPADGRSCVGAITSLAGYYEAVTHSGVTLGPLLGRLLARLILEDQLDPLLAPFSPDRFPRG